MRATLGPAVCLGALALCVLGAAPGHAAPPARDTPAWNALGRAQAHFDAYHADSALPIVAEVLHSPEVGRDPALAADARRLRGSCFAALGRAREAEPDLRFAVSYADAKGDSALLGPSLRYLAYTLSMLGRTEENEAANRRLLEFSLARADTLSEAYARLGIAYRALLEGRFAEGSREYVRCIALFRRAGESFLVRNGTVGLCRCYEGMSRIDDARRCYRDLEALCREAGDVHNLSSVLNNMGAIEHLTGDLAAAEEYYRAAYEVYRDSDAYTGAIAPACNLALVQIERGRMRDAGQVLDVALARSRTSGYRQGEAEVLERMAELRVAEGRYAEASVCIRRGLVLADSIPAQQRTPMIWTFGRTLSLMGRREEAIAVLGREAARLGDDASAYAACDLHLQLSDALRGEGRHAEALRAARRALVYARRGQSLELEFRARVKEGVSELRLGRPSEARATLEDATALWEANRERQRDPESREYLGETARECVNGLIEAALAEGGTPDGRAAFVFGAIERFKARTLRERMLGPWGVEAEGTAVPSPITLAEVQRSVLRDGELLVQSFVGSTARVIVAVTPRECRLVRLPGDPDFGARLLRLRSLASRPATGPGERRFLDEAERRLGTTLFAPLGDLLGASRRVIVSPDEELGVIPWAALVVAGSDTAASAPLVSGRELVLVPSASILADLRRRALPATSSGGARLLAVAGSAGAGTGALPGAVREVRWLERRFAGVVAREETRGTHGAKPEPLERFDSLHLAGHTTLDDEHPWRSGIRLGTPRGAEDDEFLRADRIASLRLRARLAVLSSCESASGRLSSGEGVQSLSAAFVSAGVTSTVATLWPVSDRETERFMRSFYRELARGRPVAAALRAAQSETRAREATAHPFYWAGFVVLGDGDVRMPLKGRPPLAEATAAALALGGIALWMRRASAGRSSLTRAGAGTPMS